MPEQRTQIGTLQVRGASDDNPALRLALSSLLNSADLRPIGVSPSAVLIIRHMTDPLPGRLTQQRRAMRVDIAWERSVQKSLADIYRRASRPTRGIVPLNADEAVLFEDDGEMLACLALDISKGEARERWWWKVILRTLPLPSSDGLKTLLCSKALYLPAALHHLAEWGQAVTVVNALSPGQAMTVLSAMSRAYGTADFSADTVHLRTPERVDVRGAERLEAHKYEDGKFYSEDSSVRQLLYTPSALTVKAPWERWILSTRFPQRLGKEREFLLGIGLALYHEPALVQTRAFHRAVRDWWSHQEMPSDATKDIHSHPAPQIEGQSVKKDRKEPVATEGKIDINGGRQEPVNETVTSYSQPSIFKENRRGEGKFPQDTEPAYIKQDEFGDKHIAEHRISQIAGDKTNAPIESIIESVGRRQFSETQQDAEANITESIGSVIQGEHSHPNQEEVGLSEAYQTATKEATSLNLGEGVDTQLGGVLYLINLMSHLNLPDCFEEDCGLASQVGPWGVLEVLGWALLGQDSEHLAMDPIWEALAELDGRELGKLPGEGFHGSNHFRLPKNWFNQVSRKIDNMLYWATNGKRLRLWSEQGYLLMDVPRDGATPLVQARAELSTYLNKASSGAECLAPTSSPFDQAPLAELTSPLVSGLNSNLSQWLTMVLPYLRFRLRKALNLDEAEVAGLKTATTLAETLLLYQGRLYVTSSHVDLVMSLDDISLPVRMAGLDCNPGWLPDFGRVVLFHFE